MLNQRHISLYTIFCGFFMNYDIAVGPSLIVSDVCSIRNIKKNGQLTRANIQTVVSA